jgi:hypothetical protein
MWICRLSAVPWQNANGQPSPGAGAFAGGGHDAAQSSADQYRTISGNFSPHLLRQPGFLRGAVAATDNGDKPLVLCHVREYS